MVYMCALRIRKAILQEKKDHIYLIRMLVVEVKM